MKILHKLSVCLVPLLALVLMTAVASAEDTVCVSCHGGLEGYLSEPVAQWSNSVHAQNGISCHDCHGGNPSDMVTAMYPEEGFVGVPEYVEVPEFCGRCHIGVKEDYMISAHGLMLEYGGAQCVMCHGNHDVELASIDLINEETCSQCHGYEQAEKVRDELVETESLLSGLDTSVSKLHRVGIDTEQLKGSLFSSRNSFRRTFHTVNIDRIRAQKADIEEELSATRERVSDLEGALTKRKIAGAGVGLLLILGGSVALLIRKTYNDDQ